MRIARLYDIPQLIDIARRQLRYDPHFYNKDSKEMKRMLDEINLRSLGELFCLAATPMPDLCELDTPAAIIWAEHEPIGPEQRQKTEMMFSSRTVHTIPGSHAKLVTQAPYINPIMLENIIKHSD